jgi:lauroyl/myristoyl acyltransferase
MTRLTPNGAQMIASARALLEELPRKLAVDLAAQTSLAIIDSQTRQQLGERTLHDAVATLFPSETKERLAQIADEIALHAFQDFSLRQTLRDVPRVNLDRLIGTPDQAAIRDFSGRRGPHILGLCHIGPKGLTELALDHFQIPALVLAKEAPWPSVARSISQRIRFSMVGDDHVSRGLALKRAIDELRAGGTVAVAIDGRQGDALVDAPFLGGRIRMGRGAGVLGRLTGAPIVPCALTWGAGWKMNLQIFDALRSPSAPAADAEIFEKETAAIAAEWLENFTRKNPGQLQLYRLPWLLDDFYAAEKK